jgi:hypothetical protein
MDGRILVLIEPEDVWDGSNPILDSGLRDSVLRTVDNPIDPAATANSAL